MAMRADWDHCAAIVKAARRPVFLAAGLTPENVREAIARVNPFGVDAETGVSDRDAYGALIKNAGKSRERT
jgi:phosphoribosylanthranilate isomerase